MMKTIHLIYLNFFHSVARSPGRSLRKLGDLTHIFKYHQGGCYASDTVAQGGWQQHPSHPVPAIFTRRATTVLQSADVASSLRVSTAGSAPPFVSRALCTERVPACIAARALPC